MALNKNKNTKVYIQSLGYVELRYKSVADSIVFMNLSTEQLSDKDFVIRALFNQLILPKITIEEFHKILYTELETIIVAFIENESYTFQYHEDTGDLYKDFKQAIIIGNKKHAEQLRKSFEPIIKSSQASLRLFVNNYSQIIQQSLTGTSYIQDTLKRISEFTSQIARNQQIIADSISPVLEQYQSKVRRITNSLQPQIEIWKNWADQNKRIFDSFTKPWADFQKKYNIAESKAVKVLQKYKWFITPSMPFFIIYEVIKIDKEKGRQDKAVNKLFINYFADNDWKNLGEMVDNWRTNPLFDKRRKILSDCVSTIKVCDSQGINVANIVLPTLITQIDGVISDYLIFKGISWDNEYDDWVDKRTGKLKKIGRKSQLRKTKPKILTSQLDNLANDIFLNILFQRSQKGKPLATPFNFNRHKIIHGEAKRYGRKDYLIRAFMVLDLLAHF